MVNHPNRSQTRPEITDLSDVPVTGVDITKPQVDAAIDSLKRDKSARLCQMAKGANRSNDKR
jgi:hypothetical protein